MKYRRLTSDELNELEKEFIEYLILNGITAEDWTKIKSDNPEKSEKVIDLFSDVVFESILRKINFLEYREKKSVQVFQCLAEKLVVVSMESSDPSPEIDFTNSDFMKHAVLNPPASLKIYTASKAYKESREMELFEMLQTGCHITDDKLFKALCLSLTNLS